MKITKRQLKRIIVETMIQPSSIVSEVLNDPEVPAQIKRLISNENPEQGFELLSVLFPKYKDVAERYKKENEEKYYIRPHYAGRKEDFTEKEYFQQTDLNNLLAREEERIEREPIVKLLRKELFNGNKRLIMRGVYGGFNDSPFNTKKYFSDHDYLSKKDIVIAELVYLAEGLGDIAQQVETEYEKASKLAERLNVNLVKIEKYNKTKLDKDIGIPLAIAIAPGKFDSFSIFIVFEKSRPLMSV